MGCEGRAHFWPPRVAHNYRANITTRPHKCNQSAIVAPMSKESNTSSVAPSVRHVEVGVHDNGQRLDNFLKKILKGVPTSQIYRIIRTGQVRVNSKRAKPLQKLQQGDDVRIPPVRVAEVSDATPPTWLQEKVKAAVFFEDEHVLLLNKPGGVPVHSGSGVAFGVIETLKFVRKDSYVELVHRLDRDTSGCLLLAKSAVALRELNESLRDGKFKKCYLALIKGALHRQQTVDAAIAKEQRGGEREMQVAAEGKAALSVFTPLAMSDTATLCEVAIGTGRTHQIRVHAQSLHKPLAGDDKYGQRDFNKYMKSMGLKRMFLHAARLTVPASWQTEPYQFEVPLPEDLHGVLAALGLPNSNEGNT